MTLGLNIKQLLVGKSITIHGHSEGKSGEVSDWTAYSVWGHGPGTLRSETLMISVFMKSRTMTNMLTDTQLQFKLKSSI